MFKKVNGIFLTAIISILIFFVATIFSCSSQKGTPVEKVTITDEGMTFASCRANYANYQSPVTTFNNNIVS